MRLHIKGDYHPGMPTKRDDGRKTAAATLEALESAYQERMRKAAEKAVRRLIHQAFQERLRKAHASLRGQPFRLGARVRRAWEQTGLKREEVYGETLPLGAALAINRGTDVTPWQDDPESILSCARTVGVGEDEIARSIVDARNTVKESLVLQRARKAQEDEPSESLFNVDMKSFNERFSHRRRLKR